MSADVEALRSTAVGAVRDASDLDSLEQVRVEFTGRRSRLAEVQKSLATLADDERRALGASVNALRREFQEAYEQRRDELAAAESGARFAAEQLDVTAPPRRVPPGRPHVLTQIEQEIVDAFVGLGYRVAEGPEVESPVFNFDLANIPPGHPARQDMDTMYIAEPAARDPLVLRTHTTPVQSRVMLSQPHPIAVLVPGRVYRRDTVDATHSPVFTQIEGLAVDVGLTMADLRGTLLAMARTVFGPDQVIRWRPSFFPFTEPSAEIDVSCPFCARDGSPCRVCGATGWLEILGAGMVDPDMLRACGHDPEVVSGFAFGIGIERVAMLRHGVQDMRELFDNDARFLEAL